MSTGYRAWQFKALLHNLNFRDISCYDKIISLVRSLHLQRCYHRIAQPVDVLDSTGFDKPHIQVVFMIYLRCMATPYFTANRKFIYRRGFPCFCSVKARHCRTPQHRRYARDNLFPSDSSLSCR